MQSLLILAGVLLVIGLIAWMTSRRNRSNPRRFASNGLDRSTQNRDLPPATADRQRVAVRNYVKHVGPELRKRYGKQRKYTPTQVKQTIYASGYSSDVDCYAFAMFCDRDDFVEYHRTIGESCDYNSMRSEISESCGFIFPSGTTFDAAEVIDSSDRISNTEDSTTSSSSWFSLGDLFGSSTDSGSSDYSSDSSSSSDGGGSDSSSSDGGSSD